MGHIASRGKDVWRLYYELPRGQDNRRRQASVTVHGSFRLAKDRLRAIEDDVVKGRTDHQSGGSMTVEELLDRYIADLRVGESTLERYQAHVQKRINPTLGPLPIADLRVGDIDAAAKSWGSTVSAGQTVRLLRAALETAVERRDISENVAKLVSARHHRSRPQSLPVLTPDQAEQVLVACALDDLGPLIELALRTGCRLGEVLGLRWDHVDLGRRRLTIVRSLRRQSGKGLRLGPTKTERSKRVIPLSREAVAALHRQQQWQTEQRLKTRRLYIDAGLVFTTNCGTPLDPGYVRRRWKALLAAARIRYVKFHALRHTFATLLIKEHVPIHVVQELLGHASVRTTLAFYGHLIDGMADDAVQALSRAIANTRRGRMADSRNEGEHAA